ncbi:MAG: ABC transporter ATP-binding protein [Acidobacteriota bacterium]
MKSPRTADRGSRLATQQGLLLKGVEKRLPGFHLGPVTLSLRPGRACGLLGPNGAGKTTLLNLIALQLRLSDGAITLNSAPIVWGDAAWKERFSYIRETVAFYEELPVSATLRLAGDLYQQWDARFAAELLDRFQLDPRKRVGTLSKGNKVKLGIVVALAHRADLVMLDEPTAGLDPTVRAELQMILRELLAADPQLIVVLSSHIFEDLERAADDIVIVRHGRVVFQDELRSLESAPLYRMPDAYVLENADARVAWTRSGRVWMVPTVEAAARLRSLPGCELVPGGATLDAVYHGTEHLCA